MKKFLLAVLISIVSCDERKENMLSSEKTIFILDDRSESIQFKSYSDEANSHFVFRITGYGNPNIYVSLLHPPSKGIHSFDLKELKKENLIDSDTLDFNFWFLLGENKENFIVLKKELESLEKGKINQVKIYGVDILAHSIH